MANDFNVTSSTDNKWIFSENDDSNTPKAFVTLKNETLSEKISSFFKEKLLTVFDWSSKYVKTKINDTNTLVNIDSVAAKTGLSRGTVRALAIKGDLEKKCEEIYVKANSFEMNNNSASHFTSILGKYIDNKETLYKPTIYFLPPNEFFIPDPNTGFILQYPDKGKLAQSSILENVFIFKKNNKLYINLKDAKIADMDPKQFEEVMSMAVRTLASGANER